MAENRKVPCNCEKCNGALKCERTVRLHRAEARKKNPPVHAPDFAEWQRLRAGAPSASLTFNNLEENNSDSEDSEDSSSDSVCSRPRKQMRLSTHQPEHESSATEFLEDSTLQSAATSGHDIGSNLDGCQSPAIQLNETLDNIGSGSPLRQAQEVSDTDIAEHSDSEPPWTDSDDDDSESDSDAATAHIRASEILTQLDVVENSNESEELEELPCSSRIETIAFTQQLIAEIQSATLDKDKLDADVLTTLRKPIEEPVDISNPFQRLTLDIFLACNNASEATYNGVRAAIMRHLPHIDLLSYYSAKKLVSEISGVNSILDDMCINSCMAYVGPWANLQQCPECSERRYDTNKSGKQVPRQQVCTIPLGPQLQALRRSSSNAAALSYRDRKTKQIFESYNSLGNLHDRVFDDVFCGNDFRKLAAERCLTSNDITVSFSLDGAQLYQNKKSDTWIAIWTINDYDPTLRFKKKKVLPAIVIPGPNKPKNLDSFTFRCFYHLSALQRENDGAGLRCWDALQGKTILSRILFMFGNADALGLTELDGRVGHHGVQGCRLGCDMKGRHKPSSGHYCAAHLCPNDYSVDDCRHPDYDFSRPPKVPSTEEYATNLAKVVSSKDQTDYERNRKSTGISKPSILSGLNTKLMLSVPKCFTSDLMHLLFLNLGELLIPLWRGQMRCDPTDSKDLWDWVVLIGDAWTEHGKLVAAATPFFPSSFHRPPRNPAEKISSGYKATEYYLYLFGLGPALLRLVLPKKYLQHFCKLVHGVRIIIQRRITGHQIRDAHLHLTQFVKEFEHLYYQRRVDRLHFCRPCLHTLLHTSSECVRAGPGAYNSQFTMERAIGDLGKDIRQPSNIFGNLAQIALRRSQINALVSMCPELDYQAPSLPTYAYDCGNNFALLRPRDRYQTTMKNAQLAVISNEFNMSRVSRWGRLKLPNGQNARSVFSEQGRKANIRNLRNVKFVVDNKTDFGEVQFYFLLDDANQNTVPYALVSVYGPPCPRILEETCNCVRACSYNGDGDLRVVLVSSIASVVSMQPLPPRDDTEKNLWFVVEKSGIDDTELTGYIDSISPDEGRMENGDG